MKILIRTLFLVLIIGSVWFSKKYIDSVDRFYNQIKIENIEYALDKNCSCYNNYIIFFSSISDKNETLYLKDLNNTVAEINSNYAQVLNKKFETPTLINIKTSKELSFKDKEISNLTLFNNFIIKSDKPLNEKDLKHAISVYYFLFFSFFLLFWVFLENFVFKKERNS